MKKNQETIKKNQETEKMELLYKDNSLVKTRYDLNLVENKLYTLILYKFQVRGERLSCELTHQEIKRVIKNKNENSVQKIQEVLDKISDKKIYLLERSASGKSYNEHKYHLINGHTYYGDTNSFKISAEKDIYELVAKRFDEGCYTPVNLSVFLSLKNSYAQRLYDLLRLWTGSRTIINYTVEDLKYFMMLEDTYPNYADFKRRVITPAIKELNSSGKFEIKAVENKNGRKVESIDFIVKDFDIRKKSEIDTIVEVLEEEAVTEENECDLKMPSTTEIVKKIPKGNLVSRPMFPQLFVDFPEYNFTEGMYQVNFLEACEYTVKKSGQTRITKKNYVLFRNTLKSYIASYEKGNK